MQAGSTGLGKTVLVMKLAQKSELTRLPPTSPPQGALVLYCKTTQPVTWNIWISVDSEELPTLLGQLLKPKLLWFIFKSLISSPFKSRRNLLAKKLEKAK